MRRQLYAIFAVIALLATGAVTATTASATTAPATAARAANPCDDSTIQAAPVRANPTEQSARLATLAKDTYLTGTCNYYFPGSEAAGSTWWIQIKWTGGTHAYVWIQYLNFGRNHRCRTIQDLEFHTIGGQDNWCPLVHFNG